MSAPLCTNTLHFVVHSRLIPRFLLLLQRGFLVKAQVGCSIQSLLCQQLGIDPQYVEERVQTVFLDGKPIDDVNAATVKSGSAVTLSAAVPGLAGAILRKHSFYAPLRSRISSRDVNGCERGAEGAVFLKLFNLPLKELGPSFLKRGVLINGRDLSEFFGGQSENFWAGCKVARVDGKNMDPQRLLEILHQERHFLLQVLIH